ncbi:hypothetical protein EOD41_16830 [Mucilaginibacter limnophilus]|uniref:TerB family tellurite resistance protein n=1 Tax=Mucilaginibacter limnophilus TaxID=1932778 RepID=A0A3S2UK78_9SPHI|nr:hypothetical protein [Mucilaginibacter limnophilus]RVT98454.1 hypothetical protein EOD41_16830 [Mucilaginibacter limnophilus]
MSNISKKAGALRRQSRKLLAFAMVTAGMSGQLAFGQTFSEWFKQKSTQKKYLLQQISALLVYRQNAQKGYQIAKGGLGSISGYLGREFQLHDTYYKKLKTASTAVRNEPRVKAILRWQQDIIHRMRALHQEPGLTAGERQYIGAVGAALLGNCEGLLYDLDVVLSDDRTAMSDEERLRQIGRLYLDMQENYRFASTFHQQVLLFSRSRQHEIIDAKQIKTFYGNDH